MQIDNKRADLNEIKRDVRLCRLRTGSISGIVYTIERRNGANDRQQKRVLSKQHPFGHVPMRSRVESGPFAAEQAVFNRLEKMEQRFVFC